MGFFKKVKQKINGMWYPQSITVGKPVTTDEVAKRLAIESTVSPADTFAVLKSLGSVLGRDIPKIIKFKATNSLLVSCLFCIFKHSPQKTV